MDSNYLECALQEQIEKESGLDQKRQYVGISKIADCPRKTYFELRAGISPSPESHRYCYAGYHQEADIWRQLCSLGIAKTDSRGMEVVSSWNPNFKGHIDGLTIGGELIEIKSVSSKRFESVLEKGKSMFAHFCQVQLYMRYLKVDCAFIIYRNRESYEHKIFRVQYMPNIAEKFEKRARELVKALELNVAPACECGNCK